MATRSAGAAARSAATGNPGANLKSISHRCHLREVAFVWEMTKKNTCLPRGCLQGGGHTPGPVSGMRLARIANLSAGAAARSSATGTSGYMARNPCSV